MEVTHQKLLLTCILKDDSEVEQAERMLSSFMSYCDGLCVALTGVSGKFTKLKKLIKKFNGSYIQTSPETHPQVYSKDGDKWIFSSFSEARNVIFAFASSEQVLGKYDWWLWADVDDILLSGEELQVAAERGKRIKADTVFFTYWYSVNVRPDGTFGPEDVVIEHLRERLIRPDMFKWVSRLHEVALPLDGHYEPRHFPYEFNPKEGRNCVWVHLTDKERIDEAVDRNIKILEIQAREEQHKDPRTLFYLAKTYYDKRDAQSDVLAEQLILEYLEMSGWREERSNACEYIGNIYLRRNDRQKAIEWFHKATQEFPGRHMTYLLLAREYEELGMSENANFYTDMVLRMDAPKARTTIGNPLEVKLMAASLKYNQCIKKQDLNGAITWLKTRNELLGVEDDGMLQTLEDCKELNEQAKAIFKYAQWLKKRGHNEQVKALLASIAPEMKKEVFVQYIASEVLEPKIWPKDSIVYYGSWGAPHFEDWDEKSLEKGIGGSETAIIDLSKEWAKTRDVTVFAECDDHEADGVHWRHWSTINWKDNFDTLIIWRSPHLLDRDLHAKYLLYDAHDIESQVNWSEERMKKVEKIFFKSNWHRNNVPKLPESKAVVISNGIEI